MAKDFTEMTYQKLTTDALIEHALSLGGNETEEALDYLETLDGKEVDYTDKMKADKRKKLRMKFKRDRVVNPNYDKHDYEWLCQHPKFCCKLKWSAIIAINSLFVGFPFRFDTVHPKNFCNTFGSP